ncbi:glycosyltransferase family 39 protein [bacterium]|nr:glycosyltransferase family 39 protein [bacterium]
MAGADAATTTAGRDTPRRHWPGALAILAVVLLAYGIAVLVGRAQEAANVRILGLFDPLFLWLREGGAKASDWLERHPAAVAGSLTGGVLLIVLGAAVATRRLPRAVLAPCAVLLLGVWGQALLLMDATPLGAYVYLLAVFAAAAYGWRRPMRRLAGFPPFGADAGAGMAGSWQPSWPAECAIVIAIGLVALLFRTWALTELSDFLDLEMVDSWAQSRTLAGVAQYYRYTFLTTNPGAVHLLPQWAIFHLFGSSVFTLRMAPVLWGVVATLLMYWFVRRIAGVGPAVLAAVIFATAPDQLFWSRSENGFFSPVAVLALVSLHVCYWLAARFSLRSALAAALLMPASRYFYTTSLAMFLLPIAVAGHAAVFVRGAWRKLWFVLPILALGLVAWWFHLTLLLGVLTDNYQFRHPAQIYGGTAWTRQGDFSRASPLELVRQQAASMGEGLMRTVRDMTFLTTDGFGHWYIRSQVNPHATTMNVGLVVLLALGVGYLLGQLRDPRAWLLLVWLALSLLGGIMSRDATPRRMSMLFPAAHVIGTVFVAAAIRGIRQGAGRRIADLATGLAAVALAIVVLTNTVSHFRLPMQPVIFADYGRFLLPALRDSDTVFLNLPRPFISLLQFTDGDRFVRAPWCVQQVPDDGNWLAVALEPTCTFNDAAYSLVFTPAEIEAARAAHHPRRISYVFFVDPTNQWQLDLVRALYPAAAVADYVSPRDQRHIAVVTIDLADSIALRAPLLRSAATPAPDVLADVTEHVVAEDAPPAPAAALAGGLWLDGDSWYAFELQPPCAGARLRIDDRDTAGEERTPLLAGVHRLSLEIPDPSACALPLRIAASRPDAPAPAALAPDRFTSPQVAALPAAAAPPVRTYPGYPDAKPLLKLGSRSADLAIGPDGTLHLAAMVEGRWYLQKYTPDGTPIGSWDIGAPPEMDPGTMSVADDGTVAILFGRQVILLAPDGRRLGSWDHVWFVWETQIAFWGDHLLATIPHRDSIAVFSRSGELVEEVRTFEGGPGHFFSPSSFAFTPEGDMVVLQPNGRALRLRTPRGELRPQFVGELATSSTSPGVAFDGPERLLLPGGGAVDVYDAEGTRLMAADPSADLGRIKIGKSARVRAAGGAVYLLNPEGGRVWTVHR